MISSAVLGDNHSVDTDSKSRESELKKNVHAFQAYLEGTQKKRLLVFTSGEKCAYDLPYTTRWSDGYKKKMIAKMYGVEEYMKKSSRSGVVTLLTLTGYQDGKLSQDVKGRIVSRQESFMEIKRGWNLLIDLTRKVLKKENYELDYVWVMEPHKSGYPHMHVAIFGYIPQYIKEKIQSLWSEKYKIGSKEHGVDFSVKSINESIQCVRNYLMKYISKGIGGDGQKNWTDNEWIYHALAWKYHHRYIGMSQTISRYCSARRLRYRYIRYLHEVQDLVQGLDSVVVSEVPIDKEGIKAVVKEYQWRLPNDNPDSQPPDQRWNRTLIADTLTGTVIPLRANGYAPTEMVEWINDTIGMTIGYTHQFLTVKNINMNHINPVSKQQTLHNSYW